MAQEGSSQQSMRFGKIDYLWDASSPGQKLTGLNALNHDLAHSVTKKEKAFDSSTFNGQEWSVTLDNDHATIPTTADFWTGADKRTQYTRFDGYQRRLLQDEESDEEEQRLPKQDTILMMTTDFMDEKR